jgi:microcystin-dependent protein
MPTDLRFIVLDSAGNSLGELASARSRTVQFVLDGAATATFTVPGTHPDATLVSELASDLLVYRNGVKLFRGRVGTSSDTLSADTHTVAFSAIDYRGMLDRRILWSDSPLSFRGVDQGQIAWAMIADTQRRTGGDLGITQGLGTATGVVRDRDYTPGKKIGEAVTELGDVIGGFDWEIDANLAFNVFYPHRGRSTGIPLVYGSQIASATRQVTSTNYNNALRYQGDPAATTAVEIADTIFGPTGRWEAAIGNPDLKLQTSVQSTAQGDLGASDTLIPNYQAALLEGWWDPTALWLGDIANLYIASGRLNVTGDAVQVVGFHIAYSDNGGEAVTVDLGVPAASLTSRLGDYQSRLDVIERSLTAPAGYVLDAPVGAMFSWPGATPPKTWVWADGSGLSTAAFPELFAVLGYTYGGTGGLFALPDCRSRVLVAAGAGAGLTSRAAGTTGGAETVGLTDVQTGFHQHNFSTSSGSTDITHSHTVSGNTGNDTPDHGHPLGFDLAQTAGLGTGATNDYKVVPGSRVTQGATVRHAHPFAATSGTAGGVHGHTIAGTTDHGNTNGVAHENMPPWIAIGQIIRALPPWRPQ